jgi:hypothetical protein
VKFQFSVVTLIEIEARRRDSFSESENLTSSKTYSLTAGPREFDVDVRYSYLLKFVTPGWTNTQRFIRFISDIQLRDADLYCLPIRYDDLLAIVGHLGRNPFGLATKTSVSITIPVIRPYLSFFIEIFSYLVCREANGHLPQSSIIRRNSL